ncbi:MAG: class I SAM-dependent methyltransferase [Acidimicrobiales bacterium]
MSEGAAPIDLRHKDWDAAYRDLGTGGVSWAQPEPTVSLELFERLGIGTDAAVLDVGGGASVLVDALIARGFEDVTVLDISQVALDAVRDRIGAEAPADLVRADLLEWTPERRYDVWHDRAVFHFLVDETDRRRYVALLRAALRPGGHAVVATFAMDGPRSCSGLPVARYSTLALTKALGEGFTLVESTTEEHRTPAGVVQPFTWVALRRGPD